MASQWLANGDRGRRRSERPPRGPPRGRDLETGDAIVDIDRLSELIGESSAMAGVRETLRRLLVAQARARRPASVLLLGETGVGKSMVARVLHRAGPRSEGAFVAVNCAAIPSNLLEVRAVRLRARRVHGREARQARARAGGERRDAVPRRGGAAPAGVPGQAPDGPRGRHGAAPGSDARRAGRRVDHRGDQRGPGGGRSRAPLPRGPLPSPRGDHGAPAGPPPALG